MDDISEARRQELCAAMDRYLEELRAEVGEPTPKQVAEAEAWARNLGRDRAQPVLDE